MQLKKLYQDERGLTLVEILAVVIITEIIATIGSVGLAGVIQNSREDAEVAKIQQVMQGAQLYALQNENQPFPTSVAERVTIESLRSDGYIKSLSFYAEEKFVISKGSVNAPITLAFPVATVKAGNKKNLNALTITEENIGTLTRRHLFTEGTSPP